MFAQRLYRIALSSWLFIGHGIPKVSHWIFNVETWGPHSQFVPKNLFSGLIGVMELLCSLMIILGYRIKWNSVIIAGIFLFSAFSLPFPWIHEKVSLPDHPIGFAVIISKEIHFAYALAYLSLLFFAVDEKRKK